MLPDMDILRAWINTCSISVDNTSVDSVRCPRPPESRTKDTTNMISKSSVNSYTQMCVDHFECALRADADTLLRTYAERPDMPGSSFWSASLNKQASSRTSSPISYLSMGWRSRNCSVTMGESILQKTSFYSATATVSRPCTPPPTLQNRTAYANDANTLSRTYMERPDMPGSSYWSTSLNKQVFSRT